MKHVALAILAAAVFVAIGLIVNNGGATGPDKAAFDVIDPLRGRTGLDVVRVITELGSFPAIAIVTLVGALTAPSRRETVLLIGGALVLFVLVNETKHIWDRPRPSDRFYTPNGSSYPSGHSAYAIAWIAAAATTGRRAWIWLGIVVAVTIGGSRLYLHVHYLTDVIGGFALGTVVYAPLLARRRP